MSSAVREQQVMAAVSFLTNPKVSSKSLSRKLLFLSEKGVTLLELIEACKRTQPNTPQQVALEKAVEQGTTIKQALAPFEDETTAAPAGTTTSSPSTGNSSSTSGSTSNYPAAPPGFVAGPPAFPGGPPTYYPIQSAPAAAPVPPPSSSWKTIGVTAATVLGGVAAAAFIAKRTLGLELTTNEEKRREQESNLIAGSLISQQSLAAAAGAAPLNTSSARVSSSSTPRGSAPGAATPSSNANSALVPLPSTSSTMFPPSQAELDELEEDEVESQKYLGEWLGHSSSSTSKRSSNRNSSPSLGVISDELHNLSNKLDEVVEALRENQIELRKLSAKTEANTGSLRMEQLLSQSIETQNSMLATLKIMMAAQAKASKEDRAAASNSVSSASSSSTSSDTSTSTSSGKSWIEQNLPSISDSSSSSSSSSTFDGTAASAATRGWPTATSTASSSPSPSTDPAEGRRNLEEALKYLRENNSIEDIKLSCSAMTLYIENLLNNMNQPRYRRILLSNSSYESRVRKTKGAEPFLLAAGFEINRPYIEWVLPDTSSDSSAAAGASDDGSSSTTTAILSEHAKTKHLQEALMQLKMFQQRLLTDPIDDTSKSVFGSPTNNATSAVSLSSPTSVITPPSTSASSSTLPAPSTSFSAYASAADTTNPPTVDTPVSDSALSSTVQPQIVSHSVAGTTSGTEVQPAAALVVPAVATSSALPVAPSAGAPVATSSIEYFASQVTSTYDPLQQLQAPVAAAAPVQPPFQQGMLQPATVMAAQAAYSQHVSPQPMPVAYNPAQSLSYPNTPLMPMPQQYMAHMQGYNPQSYPNTPLPPPSFQQQALYQQADQQQQQLHLLQQQQAQLLQQSQQQMQQPLQPQVNSSLPPVVTQASVQTTAVQGATALSYLPSVSAQQSAVVQPAA